MPQELLKDLMIIQIEGPDLVDLNPDPAIEAWLTGGRDPDTTSIMPMYLSQPQYMRTLSMLDIKY